MKPFQPKGRGPVVNASENSNNISDAYRDRLVISYQYLENVIPNIDFKFNGRSFETPIMAGPISGQNKVNEAGTLGYVKAVADAGSIYWSHFHNKEEWTQILAAGFPAIRVIKPLQDNNRLLEEISFDTKNGALGYAMDIDHGMTPYGEFDKQSEQFSSKTAAELKMLNEASPLPFFLKGVLSIHDAKMAADIGVAGIVVSGHNNRFPSQIPPLKILPEIRKAVGPDMLVFIDGGINNGYDVFKALALGANGVLCARSFLAAYSKEGYDGLNYKIREMTAELKGAMANTGSSDLQHINKDCVTLL